MEEVPPPPAEVANGYSSNSGPGSDSEDDLPLSSRRGGLIGALPVPTEPLPIPTEVPRRVVEPPIPRPTAGGKTFHNRPPMRHQGRSRRTGNIKVVSQPAVRRLARRGGVKRMSKEVYSETQNVAKEFLTKVLEKSCIYMEDRNQSAKTLNPGDVVRALNNMGVPMYGFGR